MIENTKNYQEAILPDKKLFDSITIILAEQGIKHNDRVGKLNYIADHAETLMNHKEKSQDVIGNIANRYFDLQRMELLNVTYQERDGVLVALKNIKQNINKLVVVDDDSKRILDLLIKNLQEYQPTT